MVLTDRLFYLLRLGLGCDIEADYSLVLTAEEWSVLYKQATKHTLRGIVFDGIQRAFPEKTSVGRPPKIFLMQWYGELEQVRSHNELLDEKCAHVTRILKDSGLDCCILKGQGIARLYPNPLLRQPGDIDVWVKFHDADVSADINRSVREIKRKLSEIGGSVGKAVYHHVDWCLDDVEVEVHYRPQQLNNPFVNSRFQKWCNSQWDTVSNAKFNTDKGVFYVPSAEFNIVYLLAHLYHHFLFEGVGLRQVCDYFVLLRSCEEYIYNKVETEALFRSFGMLRFARGMMWVIGHVFHLPLEKMVVEPDECEGRFILSEILRSGNFGKSLRKSGNHSVLNKFLYRTKYRSRFLLHYPGEILWDIPFRLYHWCWRRMFT